LGGADTPTPIHNQVIFSQKTTKGCNKSPTDKNIAQKIHSNLALQKVFEWILLFYGAIVCAICYLNLLLLQPLSLQKKSSLHWKK